MFKTCSPKSGPWMLRHALWPRSAPSIGFSEEGHGRWRQRTVARRMTPRRLRSHVNPHCWMLSSSRTAYLSVLHYDFQIDVTKIRNPTGSQTMKVHFWDQNPEMTSYAQIDPHHRIRIPSHQKNNEKLLKYIMF